MGSSPYRLGELGWLQFERLCELVLTAVGGGSDHRWIGRADRGRVTVIDAGKQIAFAGTRVVGPAAVLVIYLREGAAVAGSRGARLSPFSVSLLRVLEEFEPLLGERIVLLTNLDREPICAELAPLGGERLTVIGAAEIAACLDAHPWVRAAMPSVLGVRDLGPLTSRATVERSTFDLERARALASVFWATRAYERARQVLDRHRFVVLTGPPEMGKTATAQMLGLAHLTDGWEVHECSSPDALWSAFAAGRQQLFIADDAFGSTEYRPDAAERWAGALGRLLPLLDGRHCLIWTSRPAPLKAGLRRVQRERGAEHFPAPGEVLVDASDLDLAEKTLILFRHAKARRATPAARSLVRSSGLAIVEHPHFTPDRIRRLVTDRLEQLAEEAETGSWWRVTAILAQELSSPTEAMRTSYRALSPEHRELLVALLDAPSGMIDERELAAALRRHTRGGLNRPPHELIDRLTDHFLRVTPFGIGWVHPSFRDLVIDELAEDRTARSRFLAASGPHGVMLALSHGGGSGERTLPLLIDDGDWDSLAANLRRQFLELDDREVAHLLLAIRDAVEAALTRAQRLETQALAAEALSSIAHREGERRQMSVFLVEAWYQLRASANSDVDALPLAWTWAELHPASPQADGYGSTELVQLDEWLRLVETLTRHDPDTLAALGFFGADQELLSRVIRTLSDNTDPDCNDLVDQVLTRVERVAPRLFPVARDVRQAIELGSDDDWWTPTDLDFLPSTELVPPSADAFTREDVERVLSDLD